MRGMARIVGVAALLGAFANAGCSSDEGAGGPATDVSTTDLKCGLHEVGQVDGACAPVGPADPAPESANAFTRSVDGWGISAKVGQACTGDSMALIGEPECVPVHDCSAPFPPANAEVIVSTKSTDPRAVATIEEALTKVSRGGVIAIDSGRWNSQSPKLDVTLVGRCARDTFVGNGKNNALFVNGANVTIRGVTLTSLASPIAVSKGSITAENVIIRDFKVGIGTSGAGAKATIRHSIIQGLGAKEESMGALVARGSALVIESSELRDVSSGILTSDAKSRTELKRVVVSTASAAATSTGVNASAGGHVQVDESVIRSKGTRLVAVYDDYGTDESPTAKASAGTMAIRSSVLEQIGAELKDVAAVDVKSLGADLELTDVTLRHQTPVGILVSEGAVRSTRLAILGEQAAAETRAGIMAVKGAKVEAESLAIPWAQGLGIAIGEGSDLDLRKSLIANVSDRGDGGQEAVLVTGASASIADSELANNERNGIVAIGESNVAVSRALIHGTHVPSEPFSGAGPTTNNDFGALVLHSTMTFDGCVFAKNGEGIVAAGSQVLVRSTTFKAHRVALHAADGMTFADDRSELMPNAFAIAACKFGDNAARTSSAALPDLSVAPTRAPKAK